MQASHTFSNNQDDSGNKIAHQPGGSSYNTRGAARDSRVGDEYAQRSAYIMNNFGHPTTYSNHGTPSKNMQDPTYTSGIHSASSDNYNSEPVSALSMIQENSTIPAMQLPIPQLQFANPQQLMQGIMTRVPAHNFFPPAEDGSIPHNEDARQHYVRCLREAFLDVTQYLDETDHRDIHVRWLQIAAGHDPQMLCHIEVVCWKLLEMTEALHQGGPAVLEIFDSSKLCKVYTSRRCSFGQRINDMCDIMRISKTRCETLLTMDDMQMFVGAPAHMGNLSRRMKSHNAKRQEQLLAGRKVQKRARSDSFGDPDRV